MELIKSIKSLFQNLEFTTLSVFIVSLLLSYLVIPKIIHIAKYKQLMDNPNERSSHTDKVPTFAGVALYLSLMIGLFLTQHFDYNTFSISFMTGLTILFFIGLKDDLTILTAKTKFISQIIVVVVLLSSVELTIYDFHGFINIHKTTLILSILFSAFIVLATTNAFNLIDGIDGLAGLVGIVSSSVYAVIFYQTGIYYLFLIAIIVIASLIAFLRYNLSNDKKIFLGDTGSMILGFVMAVFTIKFLTLPEESYQLLHIKPINSLLIALAILFIPFVDTLRVFTIRLSNKKSPFSPDRNHIHHIFVDYLHYSHKKTSLILATINLLFIALIYLLNLYFSITFVTISFILLITIFMFILFHLNKSDYSVKRKDRIKSKIPGLK